MNHSLTYRQAFTKVIGLSCLLFIGAQPLSAVDSSGRNSHFWIILRPSAGITSGSDTDMVLANGYRSVNLDSPDLSCTRQDDGGKWIYQIAWKGNDFLGDAEAETLQLHVEVDKAVSGGATLQDVKINGTNPSARGFVLESSLSKVKPKRVNGRKAPKNYFETHASIVLRNPALETEDSKHPFADLRAGHTFGPTPYSPTIPEKLKSFPAFSWDRVPRGILIRKSTRYTDGEIKAIAENYDLVVLEKANPAGQKNTSLGMKHTAARLKEINPAIKMLFYWNSRIYFGHYGIDDSIADHKDEWIAKDFVIRGSLPTYVRTNPDFLKWWVGCAEQMISDPSIDGTFVDKAGVPIYMLDALYKATPVNKLVMNNNAEARQRLGYVDGTYREGWSGGGNHDTIAETIALARETGLNQKIQILRMPVLGVASKREMEDRIDRPLAIFLLFAEKYSYFYWQATVDARKGKQWEWEASYVDQLNRPLGKPLGPYRQDNKVYTRSFEYCDVYMDLRGSTRILWKNNIGKPVLEGSGISFTDNTYNIKGSGNISGESDRCFYLSDAHYGDGWVSSSINSLGKTPEAQAGIMFRESCAADARMVALLRNSDGQLQMVYRSEQGAATLSAGAIEASQRRYAMLTRKGDQFTGSCSSDGETWIKVAQVTAPMREKIEMGMTVISHSNSELAEATFSGFKRIETPEK